MAGSATNNVMWEREAGYGMSDEDREYAWHKSQEELDAEAELDALEKLAATSNPITVAQTVNVQGIPEQTMITPANLEALYNTDLRTLSPGQIPAGVVAPQPTAAVAGATAVPAAAVPQEKLILSVKGAVSFNIAFRCDYVVVTPYLIAALIHLSRVEEIPEISLVDPSAKAFLTLADGKTIEIYFPSINEIQYEAIGYRHLLFFTKPADEPAIIE